MPQEKESPGPASREKKPKLIEKGGLLVVAAIEGSEDLELPDHRDLREERLSRFED